MMLRSYGAPCAWWTSASLPDALRVHGTLADVVEQLNSNAVSTTIPCVGHFVSGIASVDAALTATSSLHPVVEVAGASASGKSLLSAYLAAKALLLTHACGERMPQTDGPPAVQPVVYWLDCDGTMGAALIAEALRALEPDASARRAMLERVLVSTPSSSKDVCDCVRAIVTGAGEHEAPEGAVAALPAGADAASDVGSVLPEFVWVRRLFDAENAAPTGTAGSEAHGADRPRRTPRVPCMVVIDSMGAFMFQDRAWAVRGSDAQPHPQAHTHARIADALKQISVSAAGSFLRRAANGASDGAPDDRYVPILWSRPLFFGTPPRSSAHTLHGMHTHRLAMPDAPPLHMCVEDTVAAGIAPYGVAGDSSHASARSYLHPACACLVAATVWMHTE